MDSYTIEIYPDVFKELINNIEVRDVKEEFLYIKGYITDIKSIYLLIFSFDRVIK